MFRHPPAKPRAAQDDDGPTFPLFLLPSFNFPFRRATQRRRTSSSQSSKARPISGGFDAESEYYDSLSSVPSLSSSPESAAGLGNSPASPKCFKSFFPELPSLNQQLRGFGGDKKPPTIETFPSSCGPRLSRIQPDTLRCNTCSTDIAFCSQIVSKGFTGRYGRAYLVSPPSSQATPSCPASPSNKSNNPKDNGNSAARADTDLVNISVGRSENRQLVTGQHVVADITCVVCGSKLGWKYVDAREQAQKYKVGKFILETQRVVASHTWEDVDSSTATLAQPQVRQQEANVNGDGKARATTRQDVYQSQPPMLNLENLNTLNSTNRHGGESRSSFSQSDSSQGSPSTSTTNSSRNSSVGNIPRSAEVAAVQPEEVIVFDSDDEDECDEIFAGIWDAEVVAKRRRHKVSNFRRNGGNSSGAAAAAAGLANGY